MYGSDRASQIGRRQILTPQTVRCGSMGAEEGESCSPPLVKGDCRRAAASQSRTGGPAAVAPVAMDHGRCPFRLRIGLQVTTVAEKQLVGVDADAAHTVRRNGSTCLLLVANREIEMIGRLIVRLHLHDAQRSAAAVAAGDEDSPGRSWGCAA